MAVTDNKPADTTSTTGGAGNALSAKEKEAKAAAAAAKNTANQKKKNHPSNASNKKKQQVAKSKFEGLASGTNPMKGTVIALANGNLLGQYRTYQNTLAGSAAADKAYGLDSVILDLVAKVESDFVTSKPDPLQHSNVVTIYKKRCYGCRYYYTNWRETTSLFRSYPKSKYGFKLLHRCKDTKSQLE